MTACSRSPIKSFEETISSINKDKFVVNCSNEVNRGKKGNINTLGYLCNVEINSATKFVDSEGNPLRIEDFLQGDLIRIILSKPQDISEGNRTFDATEIVLLDAEQ